MLWLATGSSNGTAGDWIAHWKRKYTKSRGREEKRIEIASRSFNLN